MNLTEALEQGKKINKEMKLELHSVQKEKLLRMLERRDKMLEEQAKENQRLVNKRIQCLEKSECFEK